MSIKAENGLEVTVAIPSFNQSKYLEQTLLSVINQDIDYEICVADGGSIDGSLDIIKKYEKEIRWWRSNVDDGQSSAVNEAVDAGTGRYIAWLNSDDILLPGSLRKMITYLDTHPEKPLVYGKALYIDSSGKKLSDVYTQPFSTNSLRRRCIICQPATLIRRSVWQSLEGLDESLHMSMDYDFWWRVTKKYGDVGYIDDYIAASRVHSETKTNKFRQNHYKESMRIVKKYNGKIPLIWYLKIPWSVYYKSMAR